MRRGFYEIAASHPTTTEALVRIAQLYAIEQDVRGRTPDERRAVERSIHPLALNCKNAVFAGSDQGGHHWAVIALLMETCKLNQIDPQAWLANTLSRLAAGHPATALDELMPWNSHPGVA